MKKAFHPAFHSFANGFVRSYWETVKERKFPMPPDEPVDETLEELLSAVSVNVATQSDTITMTSKHGDWWEFSFRKVAGAWTIDSARAKSLSPKHPHDLLGPIYSQYFRPFLEYVTQTANKSLNEK